MIFEHSKLRSFFELLTTHNKVVPLRDCGEEPCVIMRHDVDYDVQAAVDLAEIEEDQGLRSTYFFLTTSPLYNVAAPLNRRRLLELHGRGFEIGLHFDPLVYGDLDDAAMLPRAQHEIETLEAIVGAPVRSISIHNPSAHGKFPSFEGFNNAYDESYFAPGRYLSDSCMEFRDKDPFEFFAQPVSEIVQVLLHPLHYAETEQGYSDIFAGLVRRFSETLDREASVNPTYMKGRSEDLWSAVLRRHRTS